MNPVVQPVATREEMPLDPSANLRLQYPALAPSRLQAGDPHSSQPGANANPPNSTPQAPVSIVAPPSQGAFLAPPVNNAPGPMVWAIPSGGGPRSPSAGIPSGLPQQNATPAGSTFPFPMPSQSATLNWRDAPSPAPTPAALRVVSVGPWPETNMSAQPASASGAIPLPTVPPSGSANFGVRPASYPAPLVDNPPLRAGPFPVSPPPAGFRQSPPRDNIQQLPPVGAPLANPPTSSLQMLPPLLPSIVDVPSQPPTSSLQLLPPTVPSIIDVQSVPPIGR